ncbi:MAG: DJ-1/PfpI family protein [Candidatus Symbiothrix sp.]|jgi:4-methyl-5(b-hydroxyethyl)-thiazole monophosphate biosynthesis|nr:DJ-1/PfpI family protein [Candidatus Symbiothrix sp.]
MQTFLFLAQGFEEIEAVAVIDILRRGALNVTTVSVTGNPVVVGAHNIAVTADVVFENADFSSGKLLILPGGMPGADNLNAHPGLKTLLKQYYADGKYLAAICAAPLVLGDLQLLQGKKAVVYPGYEEHLTGATILTEPVVVDGHIITGRGPGFVFEFALSILSVLLGQSQADAVAKGMLIDN